MKVAEVGEGCEIHPFEVQILYFVPKLVPPEMKILLKNIRCPRNNA